MWELLSKVLLNSLVIGTDSTSVTLTLRVLVIGVGVEEVLLVEWEFGVYFDFTVLQVSATSSPRWQVPLMMVLLPLGERVSHIALSSLGRLCHVARSRETQLLACDKEFLGAYACAARKAERS
jgi:hypothetical protein